MPKTVAIDTMPAFTRVVTTSKWAHIAAAARDHFANAKVRDTQALVFDSTDGIDKDNVGAAMQAIRNAVKPLGFKAGLRWIESDGLLYAKCDGAYVERPKVAEAGKIPAKAAGAAKGAAKR